MTDDKKTCGDYGGETAEGEPCGEGAGVGTDHPGKGPCYRHEDDVVMVVNLSAVDLIEAIENYHTDDEHLEDDDLVVDPDDVPTEQRRLCLPQLLKQGYNQTEIGHLFGVSQQQISRDRQKMIEDGIEHLDQIESDKLASRLWIRAEQDAQALRRKGEHKKAFEVEMKLHEELRELGLLEKVPDKFSVGYDPEEDEDILDQFAQKHEGGSEE